jgi:hypothetical protein
MFRFKWDIISEAGRMVYEQKVVGFLKGKVLPV